MASWSLYAPTRTSFICDGCLNAAKIAHRTRGTFARPLTTASWSKPANTPRHALQQFPQARRAQIRAQSMCKDRAPRNDSQAYSTHASTSDPVASGIAPLPHRRLISLSGPDAAKFLQGLITNNVDNTRLSPFYAAFLDARGRVLWDVFVWVWPELVAEKGNWSCYIEVDGGEVDALKRHLKKHKLRSKIEVRDVGTEGPDGIRVWAAWGEAHHNVQAWSEITGMKDPRGEGMYRFLANADRETIAEGLQPVDAKYYHTQRYIQGISEGPAEIPRESGLPMEYNVDLSGGIDFKKGCYVGQELTIRTKHTGVVRKRVLPVQLHPSSTSSTPADSVDSESGAALSMPNSGTDIKALDTDGGVKKGRPTGKFIAGIGNVGLALCRLENMTPLRVSAEGGTYKEGAEFGVDVDGSIVKVVPVLHPWFVQRKEALWDSKKGQRKVVLDEDT